MDAFLAALSYWEISRAADRQAAPRAMTWLV